MKQKILVGSSLAFFAMLGGCGGNGDSTPPPPEEKRAQDSVVYTLPNATAQADYEAGANGAPSFKALAATTVETDRWVGTLGGAAYRIEVPKNWNGKLVMSAHGYVSTGPNLVYDTPAIRRYLVDNGYAWAASSYSKNNYDVRAGVEDTNALALNFIKIAAEKGRTLTAPIRTYIIGGSMGGHIAGAAVEQETLDTAVNKVRYDGAVPVCGVMGDTELFNHFTAYQFAAQSLAGQASYPQTKFPEIAQAVSNSLFTTFPSATTAQGDKLREIVKNLTGGERPGFVQGFGLPGAAGGTTPAIWSFFGIDGTIQGILNKNVIDTTGIVYQLDNNPTVSAEEKALNDSTQRATSVADANRLRTDGLRWIPKLNGQLTAPVVTMHTLGDNFVPFHMQQIYRKRVVAAGNGEKLVQRAIRGVSHCDFTYQEQVNAFKDLVVWVEAGTKPAGDDVITPATVASPNYGCTFSTAPQTGVDHPVGFLRIFAGMPACPAP